MTYNDIGTLSISEINNIYNETKMDMFMTESGYFLDIMNIRSFGILNESVIQESFAEKAKYIWEGIKNFFKSIKEAIKKFFGTIIDAITRSFDNQKVDSKSEKIIEVEDKKDDKAVSNNIDQTSKAFDDMTNNRDRVFGSIRANHDKLKSDIDQIKSKQSSNKSSNDASFDKISSDLDKLLTSGEKSENKKNNEPNFTMKDGGPARPSKELVGDMFRKDFENTAKKETPLMLEKKGNLFDYMKKKFDYAVNWISKEYKGEDKKFGTLSYWQFQNDLMVRRFSDTINNQVKIRLKMLDNLDYKYDMQKELDDSDPSKSEMIKAQFEKHFRRTRNYFEDLKDEIDTESYYVEIFFGESNKDKGFDEAFRYNLGLDNNVDITTKNLNNASTDIKNNIFNKNRYIKMTKQLYDSTTKIINEYESRAKNIKSIIDSGVEFYNYIGKDIINTYLKMVSNFTKYITKCNSKIQTQIKYNRVRCYEIFNNVIAFYNSNKE